MSKKDKIVNDYEFISNLNGIADYFFHSHPEWSSKLWKLIEE